jgi:hypothetical protein
MNLLRLGGTLLAVPALSAAAACGSSSAKKASANGLVTFSRNGQIYIVRADGSGERRLT